MSSSDSATTALSPSTIKQLLHLEDGFRDRDVDGGGLVFYLNLGAVRLDALFDARTSDNVTKWIHDHIQETMNIIIKDGRPASVICDMKGFSRKHTHPKLLKVIDVALDPYDCSAIQRVTFLNTSVFLKLAWKLVRPWTSDELRTLVEVGNKSFCN